VHVQAERYDIMIGALYHPPKPLYHTNALLDYFELLWVHVQAERYDIMIGALYHPPKPLYHTNALLDYLELPSMRRQLRFRQLLLSCRWRATSTHSTIRKLFREMRSIRSSISLLAGHTT